MASSEDTEGNQQKSPAGIAPPLDAKPLTRVAKQFISTAYHEAGHAVAAWSACIPFDYITVVPDPEGNSLGHCLLRRRPKGFQLLKGTSVKRDEVYLRDRIMVALAGHTAEQIYRGRNNWVGSSKDMEDAFHLISFAVESDSDEESSAYAHWLWIRTKHTLLVLWPGVEALAHVLVEASTIPYEQAAVLIEKAMDRDITNSMTCRADDTESSA